MRFQASLFAAFCSLALYVGAQQVKLTDAYPEKALYRPSEVVTLTVKLEGQPAGDETISTFIRQLDHTAGECRPLHLTPDSPRRATITCTLPKKDFQGYFAEVELRDRTGHLLATRYTAIDVSSDWKRFPRYGYLAHYSRAEGAEPKEWIEELNRFHINGLQFYDFQYRHEQPLAGTIEHPEPEWKDIAGRRIEGDIVRSFINEAHRHGMMAMAYNASYSAYDDAFTRQQNPLPLQWGIWKTPNEPRTAATAKRLQITGEGWSTKYLFYMNQNDPAWQDYLFGRMKDLLAVYPFDGWHVDTFGDKGGYAYDGSYVDYISGFRSFIDRASDSLHRPIIFNAVNAMGQEFIARSAAEFVYSELWEDHETYASILETAEQDRVVNPQKGIVFAAYLHRLENKEVPLPAAKEFNPPAVLLADAAIFASGAAHIELGDGDRMLSSEYFPADTRLSISPALHEALRHYYDYLTAYENYLRDEMVPAEGINVSIGGQPSSSLAVPGTIWTIARQNANARVIHLINLRGSEDPHWRDISMSRPDAPLLREMIITVSSCTPIRAAGWASPDVDGGTYHSLQFQIRATVHGEEIVLHLPSLHYWDTIFLLK